MACGSHCQASFRPRGPPFDVYHPVTACPYAQEYLTGNLPIRALEGTTLAGSPSMRRRRLAAELRRLRADAGLSIEETAGKLKWPGSKVSRIENRQVGISPRDLRKLLDLYQVDDRGYRDELLEIGRRATERGWWQSYSGAVVPRLYANLIGL